MGAAHFLRDDILSTVLATGLVSALFAIPPGYVLGWLTGLLDFRRQTLAWRFRAKCSGIYFSGSDSGVLAGQIGWSSSRSGYLFQFAGSCSPH